MKKAKEPLKKPSLYKRIVKALKAEQRDPNPFNVRAVIKELTFTAEFYAKDIILERDIILAIKNVSGFFTPLSYVLARRNKKELDDVAKYLKQELKEIPGEEEL